MSLLDKFTHKGDKPEELEDHLAPSASPEKLAAAEEWTKRKRAETDATRREFARYELEVQLETGVPRDQRNRRQ